MCKILLSINPEHVEHILNGTKIYEFRKTRCREDVDSIIIYATSPIKKVVAEAKIDDVLEGTPANIWRRTKRQSGISKDFFFQYYQGNTNAVAYKITNVTVFKKPRLLSYYGVAYPPQSYIYINK